MKGEAEHHRPQVCQPDGVNGATPGKGPAELAFERADWADVHELLSPAGTETLGLDDLDRLAIASYLTGHDDDAVAAWDAAHQRHLDADDPAAAALCAFWAAFCSMMRGQMAHAGGWLGRAQTIMGDDLDCRARGYVMIPALLQALDAGDPERATELAIAARGTATRFDDTDLAAFATLGHGQALLALGDEESGLGRFDEVMLSVCGGDVGPIVSGVVYCAVVLECMQLFDLARASEWTAALADWCETQPDLGPVPGAVPRAPVAAPAGGRRLGSGRRDRLRSPGTPDHATPPGTRTRLLPGR